MKEPVTSVADQTKAINIKRFRWIAFLSRVAFICNLFFLATALLQYKSFVKDPVAVSTIVILGYFLAVFLFNPLVNICYFVLLVKKKKLYDAIPQWLVIANFIFLILQILYILFLNDLQHS